MPPSWAEFSGGDDNDDDDGDGYDDDEDVDDDDDVDNDDVCNDDCYYGNERDIVDGNSDGNDDFG